MKRSYLILFAAVAVFAGCSRPDVDKSKPEVSVEGISFKGIASSEKTRLIYENEAASLKPEWVKGDLLGMFAECGGSSLGDNVAYKALSDGKQSDFASRQRDKTIVWADETSAHDFYAYYPYSEDAGADWTAVPVSVPDEQTQVGNSPNHLAAWDFMYASVIGAAQDDGEAVELSFDHLFSVLEVQLTADRFANLEYVIFRSKDADEKVSLSGGKVNLSTGALDVSGATTSGQIKLNCESVTVSPIDKTSVFMVITPGHAGKEFDVIAKVGSEEYTVATVKSTGGIPVGRTAVVIGVPITVDPEDELPDPAIDLSANGTANTYYVFQPGTEYKFKANVKGNGVARDYVWNIGGNEIAGSYSNSFTKIDPKSVLILWYNTPQEQTAYQNWVHYRPIAMSSIIQYDGYIRFRTSKNAADKHISDPEVETFKHGNVVIAAFAEEGVTYDNIQTDGNVITNATILWSWNIVVTDADPDNEAYQIQVGDYTIMDRNLGATRSNANTANLTDYKIPGVIGNHYQWGRKDPFPTVSEIMGGYGTWNEVWCTPTYTPIVELQQSYSSGGYGAKAEKWIFGKANLANSLHTPTKLGAGYSLDAAIGMSAKYPYRLLYSGTATGSGNTAHWAIDDQTWANGAASDKHGWRYLWGNPSPEAAHGKSIYDPCPVGWVVASHEMLEYVTTKGSDLSYYNERLLKMNVDSKELGFVVTTGRNLQGQIGNTKNEPVYLYTSGFASDNPTFNVRKTEWGKTTLSMIDGRGAWAHSLRCMKDTGGNVPEPIPSVPGAGGVDNMDNWNGWE